MPRVLPAAARILLTARARAPGGRPPAPLSPGSGGPAARTLSSCSERSTLSRAVATLAVMRRCAVAARRSSSRAADSSVLSVNTCGERDETGSKSELQGADPSQTCLCGHVHRVKVKKYRGRTQLEKASGVPVCACACAESQIQTYRKQA
eukprot:365443-Chlamydomonas_euryale.AAC.27